MRDAAVRELIYEWWDAALQKRLAWALFVLLSTLVCRQPTELIFGFFFFVFVTAPHITGVLQKWLAWSLFCFVVLIVDSGHIMSFASVMVHFYVSNLSDSQENPPWPRIHPRRLFQLHVNLFMSYFYGPCFPCFLFMHAALLSLWMRWSFWVPIFVAYEFINMELKMWKFKIHLFIYLEEKGCSCNRLETWKYEPEPPEQTWDEMNRHRSLLEVGSVGVRMALLYPSINLSIFFDI